MGILDSVRSARNAAAVIAEHAASKLEGEVKALYLRALAMTAYADGSLAQSEKDYLSVISNSIGFPPDQLELLILSSENPEQAVVSAVLEAIPGFPSREVFIYDCVQIAGKAGEPAPDTLELLTTFAEIAGVTLVRMMELRKLSGMLTGADLYGARVYLDKKFGTTFEYLLKSLKFPLPAFQSAAGPFGSFGVQSGFETVVDTNTGLFLIHEPSRSVMEWGLARMYIQKLNAQTTLGSSSWRLPEIGELALLNDSKLLKEAFWSVTPGKDKDTYQVFDFSNGTQTSSSPLGRKRVAVIREM